MGYQIELRHFTYFLAVAEELHFRKAADRLFISQPGLSRQIKQMEEIIGVTLFIRNKRKVSLTVAGEYLKKELDYIFNHIDFTIKQTRLIDKGSDGEIRIGFLGSAMQTIIPELLIKVNEQYSNVQFSLEEMSNHLQVEGIEKDQLDLGFVRLARVPKGIQMKTVHVDTFSLVLPKNHYLEEKNFKNIAQVSDQHFILFSSDYSSLYYDKIMSICEDKGFTPKVSHKSVHAQTIFKLVESGLGVAIVPTSLQYGFDLGVKFLEIPKISQKATLSVIWKQDNRNPVLEKIWRFL
ncbi:LysR family transcriptional regulator [Aquimarina muelleri]|uniref:LysR family transcriptional regulator n=1 Tax=Aquimarina muelleri TaxID=279356 RepID=A0A918JUH6_9FLAO|nr:LysR family transcriptional regulator [Aquimarina muelleri]MCX2761751.1 LysR family transcriptional regulator [Aquimarina muelleri]GGX15912.1 LysR family transcriptional regulator [Aquimarina muelleri]